MKVVINIVNNAGLNLSKRKLRDSVLKYEPYFRNKCKSKTTSY